MPWERPSLAEIIKRNQGDLESQLPGVDATVRRRNINVISKIISAVGHGIQGMIAYYAKQMLVDTAEQEYLDRHANMWLSVPRKPATFAMGTVVFTGIDGSVIPQDAAIIRNDGVEFTVTEETVIENGSAAAQVVCITAGQTGNTNQNVEMSLSSPVEGVNPSCTVSLIDGGDAAENDAQLRDRVISRIQSPPHGGALQDYVNWALEVPGNTRAWASTGELGDGTVTVRFVRDNDQSFIPNQQAIDETQSYLDEVRPTTAIVYAAAPIAQAIHFEMAIYPDTAQVKEVVTNELRTVINRSAVPGQKILISHLRAAISNAAGEDNYEMSTPQADIEVQAGHIATMGDITWL